MPKPNKKHTNDQVDEWLKVTAMLATAAAVLYLILGLSVG